MAKFLISAFADEAHNGINGQIEALKRNGLFCIEPRAMNLGPVIAKTDEELAEIKRRFDEEGIIVPSFGSPIGKYKITDDFEPHLELFRRALYVCKVFGAKRMRIFSFFVEQDKLDEYRDEVIRRMKELTEITQVDGMFMKSTDLSAGSWDYASAYDCDGVHALDLVRYLAGGEVVDCATVAANFSGCPVENAWSSVMRFDNGVTGTMRSNYQAGARLHMFEIHGPKASAFINVGMGGSECEATILYTTGGSMYSLASGGVGGLQKEHLDGMALAGTDKFYAYYGYKQEDENFVKAILNDEEPLCSIADAALSMKLVETVHATAI